jgi:hypothetical protein
MKFSIFLKLSTTLTALLFCGCAELSTTASNSSPGGSQAPWETLFDGKNLNSWTAIGNANWRLTESGLVQAELGNGFLVSTKSYQDFQIQAEFWVDDDANSGIFMRVSNPVKIDAVNAYEVNIFDKRPDPTYGTGSIVNVAKVVPMPKAGGHWNTYDITAKGNHYVVYFNGVKTVDVTNENLLKAGPIALQYAGGVVKFKSVMIRPI